MIVDNIIDNIFFSFLINFIIESILLTPFPPPPTHRNRYTHYFL